MQEGQPSRTAEYMALFRAVESARPAANRLFSDPLARAFVSPRLRVAVDAARRPFVNNLVCRYIDKRYPGVRTSAVARTRFIDECVDAAAARGAKQLVILGAGFDARAYRLPACRNLTVFEIDHPATQSKKRAIIEKAAGGIPAWVRFVANDFQRDSLATTTAAAGYIESLPTLFVWEGVTNYLDESAVDGTLRWCARSVPSSQVVFTYIDRAVLDDPTSFTGTENVIRSLNDLSERWTFGIDPAHIGEFVEKRGLRLLEDVGAAQYRERYFGEAAKTMRGYEFYRIARTQVAA